jgi:hypothetical protein
MTRIWELQQSGSDHATLRDAYARFLLMTNLPDGSSFRGSQLYLWKKRDVFQTMVSRLYGKNLAIPPKPLFSELRLSEETIAEIDYRFEALAPYLKPGSPT